jgi:hypothetical protein
MVIRLGGGFWVDASDGQNWTLRKGDSKNEKKKKADAIGYYSTLAQALRGAAQQGVMTTPYDGDLGGANTEAERVAADILSQVDLEFSKDELRGTVFQVTEKGVGRPEGGVAA